jgi:NADH dehydrogenase
VGINHLRLGQSKIADMDGLSERIVVAEATKRPRRPRIVIVGAGFGGLSVATRLGRADADVTVIDQHNHHLFKPLLYQVATAALSPADIAAPIRSILGRQRNTRVMLGTVTGVDKAGRAVMLGKRRVPYDYLVVATGARDAYFGHGEIATAKACCSTQNVSKAAR